MIVYYLTDEASIASDAMEYFGEVLDAIGHSDRIDLFVRSRGGRTEVPWHIVQIIRSYCSKFRVLITEVAHSAATHISLGADEIIMTRLATLSPVDPSRTHPLLPKGEEGEPIPISVQDLKHAVEFVQREAGEPGLTGPAYGQIMSALFEKVHPLAIGAIEQSYGLARIITERLLCTHMDPEKEANEINRITTELLDGYKSHGFPIGLIEARRLGLKVTEPDQTLKQQMCAVAEHYKNIVRVPKKTGSAMVHPIGHIDSTDMRFDCIGAEQTIGGKIKKGAQWMKISP